MVTRLYILRHGIAVPHGTANVPENDRPLTVKGEERVRDVVKALRRLDLNLDRIVTSPLPRARRTAEIAAEVLGLFDRLENADLLAAGASPRSVRDWLATRQEERLMIVGHNPTLSDLVGLLTGQSGTSSFDIKKGGVVALHGGRPKGGFVLHWFATPRLLRKLAKG